MKETNPTTKRERRQANLLAGKLTPSWAKGARPGAPLRQFLRQMWRRP